MCLHYIYHSKYDYEILLFAYNGLINIFTTLSNSFCLIVLDASSFFGQPKPCGSFQLQPNARVSHSAVNK